MRRLHRACRRRGGAILPTHSRRCAGQGDHHARRARDRSQAASAAGGLHRAPGAAVRLLHQRHDHERGRPAGATTKAQRRRCPCGARDQSLPLRHPCPRRQCRDGGLRTARLIMNAPTSQTHFSRRAVLTGGALTVGFTLGRMSGGAAAQAAAGAARRLDPAAVDAYLAVNADGTVTVYCGKVDLGQGLRIAIPQIAAEELDIGIDKIRYVEGDTALTPNQGRTSGSNGIQRGGMQIRQAAATARKGLIDLAAQRLNAKPEDLVCADGEIRPKAGGAGVSFAKLLDGRQFELKLDPKAPLKDPKDYKIVGKALPRPDVAQKCFGTATYIQDFTVPGMLHARVIRPPAIGATLVSVDEDSVKSFAGTKLVKIQDFLAVVCEDEWTAVKASQALRANWSEAATLPEQDRLVETLRSAPGTTEQAIVAKGTPVAPPPNARTVAATYYWPMQSHASLGPS